VHWGRITRTTVAAAVVALGAAGVPAQAAPIPPSIEGPDIPAVTTATPVVAFADEVFSCTDTLRHATVTIPDRYNRVVLEFSSQARTDPWDRLFAVTINGVEVLRGTTPRTEFTVKKDITEFSSLLPAGGASDVGLSMGSFVGELSASVRLLFYADEPTAMLVRAPVDSVVAPFALASLGGDGQQLSAAVAFPAASPSSATVELTLTGHGDEEFWYTDSNPALRSFDVLVDGTVVASATALPYTYAFLGFGGPNANIPCSGPGNAITGDTLHPVLWWGAQRALDAAGVHLGVGEIPPYRAAIDASLLPLLAGNHTVSVQQHNGGGRWITGLTFLLNQ